MTEDLLPQVFQEAPDSMKVNFVRKRSFVIKHSTTDCKKLYET